MKKIQFMAEPDKKSRKMVTFSLKAFLDFLGSARMAVVLLPVAALLSAAGTLIPRKAQDFRIETFCFTGNTFSPPQSPEPFYCRNLFLVSMAFVALNLIVCCIRRLGVLRRRGDDVSGQGAGRWGSLVTHSGILIVMLGASYGHIPGIGKSGMVLLTTEGMRSAVTMPGFTLKLLDADSRLDSSGRITDFRSTLQIDGEGGRTAAKTIRANEPLCYRDFTICQAGVTVCGVRLKVSTPGGRDCRIAVKLNPDGIPYSRTPARAGDLFLQVRRFWPGNDHEEGTGQGTEYAAPAVEILVWRSLSSAIQFRNLHRIDAGKPLVYEGCTVEIEDIVRCVCLKYRKDPGFPAVLMGFLIVMAGLALSLHARCRGLEETGASEK